MDDRIRKVLDYIEDNLSSPLGLKELAEVACMSKGHFHRAFKAKTGRTPFKFIEEIKMSKAFQLLTDGSGTVQKLTIDLGYKDYETFSRAFKKHYFIAPDDLKAIAQKIREEALIPPEHLIIKTFEVEKLSEVQEVMDKAVEMIKGILKERGLPKEVLDKAKVMPVLPKIGETKDAIAVVKNKFIITEDRKIWQQLLNETSHGNH